MEKLSIKPLETLSLPFSRILPVSEVSGLVVLEVDFIGLAVFTWPDYQVWFPLQV